jgi:hypothetical protein
MTDKSAAAKLGKLLEALRDLHEKQGAILEEADALLEGKASIGEKLKTAEAAFDLLWSGRYAAGRAGSYVWRYQVDRPNMKRLLRKMPAEELTQRMVAYLRSEDPFYLRSRHPFSLFVSSINSWAPEQSAADFALDAPAVADCKHAPACRSDQEHTKKKLAEMRA